MERIDKYLRGEMSEQEAQAFLSEVEGNEELRAELHYLRAVQQGIAQQERAALKAHLQSLEAKPKKRYLGWVAAASVILCALAFYTWKQQPAQVAQAYFDTLPNMIQPIVRGNAAQNEAFLAYETENFAEAERLFAALGDTSYAVLYRAVCLLKLDREEEAKVLLAASPFQEDPQGLEYYRQWYLALAHLNMGEVDHALRYLDRLSAEENPMQTQASALRHRLR